MTSPTQVNALIVTVGTSLINNWRNPKTKEWKGKEVEGNKVDSFDALKIALRHLGDPEDVIEYGAEINSICSIQKRVVDSEIEKIVFLVSDTEEGIETGKTLVNYYEHEGIESNYAVIEKLQDSDQTLFRQQGLPNLIKTMSFWIRELKKMYNVGINATGGYKAQIAFAVLLGQVMKVPVFYRFERFPEVISLPPLPVNYDFAVWEENLHILQEAYLEGQIERSKVPFASNPALEVLFEPIEEVTELSPAGYVFYEAFIEYVYTKFKPPADSTKSLDERLDDIHLEKSGHILSWESLHNKLDKLMKENGFVESIASFYYNPDSAGEAVFRLPRKAEIRNNPNVVEFVFSEGGKSASLNVFTTAKNAGERVIAIDFLNNWLHNS